MEGKQDCGPKLTDVDYGALQLESWTRKNLSWDVINNRYEKGQKLGSGNMRMFLRYISIIFLSSDLSSILTKVRRKLKAPIPIVSFSGFRLQNSE